VGACYIGVLSGLNTVVQVHAPPEARGRILGLYMLALGTVYPIGSLLQGQLADSQGIRAVTAGSGVVLLAVMIVVSAAAPAVLRGLRDPGLAQLETVGQGPGAAVPSGE
jgi:predicted MFS family arabinose efflux permease